MTASSALELFVKRAREDAREWIFASDEPVEEFAGTHASLTFALQFGAIRRWADVRDGLISDAIVTRVPIFVPTEFRDKIKPDFSNPNEFETYSRVWDSIAKRAIPGPRDQFVKQWSTKRIDRALTASRARAAWIMEQLKLSAS